LLDNLLSSVDYPMQDNFAAMEFLEAGDLSAGVLVPAWCWSWSPDSARRPGGVIEGSVAKQRRAAMRASRSSAGPNLRPMEGPAGLTLEPQPP
jgi:hypothetical protein